MQALLSFPRKRERIRQPEGMDSRFRARDGLCEIRRRAQLGTDQAFTINPVLALRPEIECLSREQRDCTRCLRRIRLVHLCGQQSGDNRSRERRASHDGIRLRESRSRHLCTRRSESDVRSAARFDEHTIARIDCGYADYAGICRGIERRRARSIVADSRDDDVPACDNDTHDTFENSIGRPDQAHVDNGHPLARHPCKCIDDRIDCTARYLPAVDVGTVEPRVRRSAAKISRGSHEQRRNCRAVRCGNRRTATVLLNVRGLKRRMRTLDTAIDEADANPR